MLFLVVDWLKTLLFKLAVCPKHTSTHTHRDTIYSSNLYIYTHSNRLNTNTASHERTICLDQMTEKQKIKSTA